MSTATRTPRPGSSTLPLVAMLISCGGQPGPAADSESAGGSSSGMPETNGVGSNSGPGETGAESGASSESGSGETGIDGGACGPEPCPEATWVVVVGGGPFEKVTGIAAAPDGRTWLAGTADLPASVSDTPFPDAGGATQAGFATQLDPDGTPAWIDVIAPEDSNNEVHDIALDGEGNAYLLLDLPNTGVGAVHNDVVLRKYDGSGGIVWNAVVASDCEFPTQCISEFGGVSTDASGNSVVAYRHANTDLGGNDRLALRQITADGSVGWSAVADQTELDVDSEPFVVEHGANDDVFFGGQFKEEFSLSGSELLMAAGFADGVFGRLTADGGVVEVGAIGSADSTTTTVADLDEQAGGGLLVAGGATGSVEIAGQTIGEAGANTGYLAALMPDGTVDWVFTIPGRIDEIEVDAQGNIYLLAEAYEPFELEGVEVPVAQFNSCLLASIDASGALRFARLVAERLDEFATIQCVALQERGHLAIDNEGGIYVAGRVHWGGGKDQAVDFGGGVSVVADDDFVIKFQH